MFWTILATFIATSLVWLILIMWAINWAQRQEINNLKGEPKKEASNE